MVPQNFSYLHSTVSNPSFWWIMLYDIVHTILRSVTSVALHRNEIDVIVNTVNDV